MTVSTEQKVQQKSTRKNKNNNNGTSYANLHITFSHDRYFATNFLLRFSTTVLGRSNYSATSNNMKLVHWPLMGGLLRFVQRGGDWAGPQPAQAPPRCTKRNSPPINGQFMYQSPYCCVMVRCFAVLTWVLKG